MAKGQRVFETAFDVYREVDFIGQGGSGMVYKVENGSQQPFAIKSLNPDTISKSKVKRFQNELYFCLKNVHENVLKVLDWCYTTQEGSRCPFYVMEYYPRTLENAIELGIPQDKVLTYFDQILDGVDCAHLQGIFHRDLKPTNILCSSADDRLVIADFGIAHFSEEQLHTLVKTRQGERLANFQYAAPEQRRKRAEVTHLADIYTLGLILNEMFTGEVPQGTGFKTISSVDPEYSFLDGLVDEMMRQAPTDRPQSIGEIKRELIGRGFDFVEQQKLNKLKNTVVPTSEITDPLVNDPIQLVALDSENKRLILILNHEVPQKWIELFRSNAMRTQSSNLRGRGQHQFEFAGEHARTPLGRNDSENQDIIDAFKDHLVLTNNVYRAVIEKEDRDQERLERERLQKEIERNEERARLKRTLNI